MPRHLSFVSFHSIDPKSQFDAILRLHEKKLLQRLAEEDMLESDDVEVTDQDEYKLQKPVALNGHHQNTTALITTNDGDYPPTLRLQHRARPIFSQVQRKDDTSYIICTEVQVMAAKAPITGAGSRLSLLMPTSVGVLYWVTILITLMVHIPVKVARLLFGG